MADPASDACNPHMLAEFLLKCRSAKVDTAVGHWSRRQET